MDESSPNHGSGEIECPAAKTFYLSEKKVYAVTVEVIAADGCVAELHKNYKNKKSKVCATVVGSLTVTCFHVQNLTLKCTAKKKKTSAKPKTKGAEQMEGVEITADADDGTVLSGNDKCKYRITQIDVPEPQAP